MQQSNTYIIIFTLLMTIFFGTLLSFTRMQLGPIQKVQVEIDTKKKILGAVMEIIRKKLLVVILVQLHYPLAQRLLLNQNQIPLLI